MSTEDRGVKDLNPSQGFEVHNSGDSRFQDLSFQLHGPTTFSGIPDAMYVPEGPVCLPNVGGLLPGPVGPLQEQLLGIAPPMTQAPDSFDRSFWVGFRAFSDDPTCVNGPLPDQRITTGDDDPHPARGQPFVQTTQFPFTQWRDVSHGQSSRSYSEGTTGTHPTSHFRCNQDQTLGTLEHIGSQWSPQTESVQHSVGGGRACQEWRCRVCPKKYQRAQELKRHIIDKHRRPQKCPFCHTKWTRPEKIKAHLIAGHRDRFTVEEQRAIRHLRGRKDIIRFLKNGGAIWLP